MKYILKLEELMFFILSIYLFSMLNVSWWLFPALLLVPDIFMVGYLVDTKLGAFVYNIGHHRGLILAIYFLGLYLNSPWIMLAAIIFFAHSTMDRIFGYGLKFDDDFKHTHLD